MPLKRPVPSLHDLGTLEPPAPVLSTLKGIGGERRSLSPPPESVPTSKAERELAETRAEMQDARELIGALAAAAQEAASRRPLAPELPWWRTTGGMVKVIGAGFGGLVAATGSIVLIINALRAPTDPQLRADVDSIKGQVSSLRAYLEKKDEARAEENLKRFDAMNARIVDLDIRYPAPKKHPDRPPN